jgi:hypothetical protein
MNIAKGCLVNYQDKNVHNYLYNMIFFKRTPYACRWFAMWIYEWLGVQYTANDPLMFNSLQLTATKYQTDSMCNDQGSCPSNIVC